MNTRFVHFSLIVLTTTRPSAFAEECAVNPQAVKICADWEGEEVDPVVGTDFSVDFGCQGCEIAPAVELETPKTNWRIRSERLETLYVGQPGNIGLITTTGEGDYEVLIDTIGGAAGAKDIASAVFQPSGDHYASITVGSHLEGSIGAITLQSDSGGSGGDLQIYVEGSVTGNVNAETISDLVVDGDVVGSVSADSISGLDIAGTVYGSVTATSMGGVEIGGDLKNDLTATTVQSAVITIDGDLTADLTIQSLTDAQVIIGGNVTSSASINIPSPSSEVTSPVEFFRIIGDLDGDVTLGTVDGFFTVRGSVGTLSTITVEQFVADTQSGLNLNENAFIQVPGTWRMMGDIVLTNGMSSGSFLIIWGETTSSASIDLTGDAVAGALFLGGGGSGNIVNGGTVTGSGCCVGALPYSVELGAALLTFSGTASFTNVAEGSTIALVGADMDGTLSISGDMAGEILFQDFPGLSATADFLRGGVIDIGGTMSGSITFESFVAGDVQIDEDMTGSVALETQLSATGRIMVDGIVDGPITIEQDSKTGSQIVIGGIEDDGSIVINQSEQNYDANGDIFVGDGENAVFDGCILVNGSYGDLNGDIEVSGCHEDSTALNICVDGDINGSIQIKQVGCDPQVSGHSCGGCP